VSGVPLPQTAVPPPKVVVPPPGDAVLFFGQLIFGKIITIVVTSDQILRLKCTKFYFGWGSAPDPAERAYSAPPDLAEFKGPTSKGREERGWKGKGVEGKEGKGRRGNVAFHHLLLSNLTTDVNCLEYIFLIKTK